MEIQNKDKVEIKILDFEKKMKIGGEKHTLTIEKCEICRWKEEFRRDDGYPYDGEIWYYYIKWIVNEKGQQKLRGHWSYVKAGKLTVRLNVLDCPSDWWEFHGMIEGSEKYEKTFFPVIVGTQLIFSGNITYQMSY